jgi:hypothetical protein
LEFLAFEYGSGGVGRFEDVLCDAGATWVGDGVYAELDLVDEVEVWLEEGACQILVPYFFPHK